MKILTKGGNVDSKVVFWKGQILIQTCVLKAERIEAQGGVMRLKYPFLNCLNPYGAIRGKAQYPREFLDSTWPSLSLPVSCAMILNSFRVSLDPISLYV